MSQPSYASTRATPTVPTDTTGAQGNTTDAAVAGYNDRVQASMPDVPQPGPGHPANADGHGSGALGYLGYTDGELGAIGGQGVWHVATSPVPMDWPGETMHPAQVDTNSYDAVGQAAEAGPLSDLPMPSGGHPAAYSGLTQSAYDTSEEN